MCDNLTSRKMQLQVNCLGERYAAERRARHHVTGEHEHVTRQLHGRPSLLPLPPLPDQNPLREGEHRGLYNNCLYTSLFRILKSQDTEVL